MCNKGMEPIWRCRGCGAKTHRKLWKDGKTCPVCEQSVGYATSTHGGLNDRQIQSMRSALRDLH